MGETKMKNMIVLRNLPSNVIEEAFVIVKSAKKAKDLERIEKKEESKKTVNHAKNKEKTNEKSNKNNYIIKEAEIVISSYIESLELKEKKISTMNKKDNKNTKLKIYSCLTTIIILVQILITYLR